mgnify:CR=1 FL=1
MLSLMQAVTFTNLRQAQRRNMDTLITNIALAEVNNALQMQIQRSINLAVEITKLKTLIAEKDTIIDKLKNDLQPQTTNK